MQLEKRVPALRTALAAASCALLGVGPAAVAASDPAQMDSALLYYTEKDRVNVVALSALATFPIADERAFTLAPTIDVITGASPNGASATTKPQLFGGTTVAAGQLPLKSFSDQRYALDLGYQYPVDRMSRSAFGLNFSSETDYRSIGASYSHMIDYNNKLTTLTIGLSGSLDTVAPSGGVVNKGLTPVSSSVAMTTAAASMATSSRAVVQTVTRASGGSSGSGTSTPHEVRDKQVVDAVIGVTQVINRRTLMQFNYGVGVSSGYLTDPYKIISQVNSATGETIGYLTEQRPDSRLRQTLYWKTVVHLPHDVIHLSYRHYWDDWSVTSDTVELNYHFKFGDSGYYLEPQWRYYSQSAADFYHHSLVAGSPLPSNASADYRLAAMNSTTVGLKFAKPIGKDGEFSVRAMRMKQSGNSHPDDAIGVQQSVDLYPGLDASIIQLGWNFTF